MHAGYQQDSARAEQLTAENTALQDNMVRLTSDNAALLDRVERLKARLKESNVLNSSSSFQSIPIPGNIQPHHPSDHMLIRGTVDSMQTDIPGNLSDASKQDNLP